MGNLRVMGKDKLKRFKENISFKNLFQPELSFDSTSHELKENWQTEFCNKNPIILELGCGRGEYTTGLAKLFPNQNFIGIDIKGARLWKGAKTATENKLINVRFLRTKVDFIEKFFGPEEVDEIWLTFSDPQPKKPRKRLTSPLFINRYKTFLKKNGIIHLKTDSDLLYEYTLEQIKEQNFTIIKNINDIYSSKSKLENKLMDLLHIKTFYEEKWLKESIKIKYISFRLNN